MSVDGLPAVGVEDVLVLRALGLGDALTAVPALRGLRRAYPGAVLWLAGPREPSTWLRRLGIVDEVLPTSGLQPLPWHPTRHVAVNLHGRGPESHAILAATDPARLVAFASGEHRGPAWRHGEHDVERWCRLVRSVGATCEVEDLRIAIAAPRLPATVLLHPGAASPARHWPEARWAAVAAALAARGADVAVTGSGAETGLAERVVARARASSRSLVTRLGIRSVAGTTDVDGLARLVAGATLVICGDTGVAQLATALGTRSVLLFGPTPPAERGPLLDPELHRVLWHGEGRRGNPHGLHPDSALLAIDVAEVLGAVDALDPALAR